MRLDKKILISLGKRTGNILMSIFLPGLVDRFKELIVESAIVELEGRLGSIETDRY
jgi:hypothetical protein